MVCDVRPLSDSHDTRPSQSGCGLVEGRLSGLQPPRLCIALASVALWPHSLARSLQSHRPLGPSRLKAIPSELGFAGEVPWLSDTTRPILKLLLCQWWYVGWFHALHGTTRFLSVKTFVLGLSSSFRICRSALYSVSLAASSSVVKLGFSSRSCSILCDISRSYSRSARSARARAASLASIIIVQVSPRGKIVSALAAAPARGAALHGLERAASFPYPNRHTPVGQAASRSPLSVEIARGNCAIMIAT